MDPIELLKGALHVLEAAPVKFQIDFDPYWWWYDQKCIPMIRALTEVVNGADAIRVRERSEGGSDDRTVASSNSTNDPRPSTIERASQSREDQEKSELNPNAGLERI